MVTSKTQARFWLGGRSAVAVSRALSALVLLGALGCARPIRPVVMPPPAPAKDDEPLLTDALERLELDPDVVDASARCSPRLPSPARDDSHVCQRAPEALQLSLPELHDARREPDLDYLWSPERYQRVIRRLEAALSHTRAGSPARKKILAWLVNAYDRLRATRLAWADDHEDPRGSSASPCLVHYLTLLSDEEGPGTRGSLLRYTLAVEYEHLGARARAEQAFSAIAAESPRKQAFWAANVALGDAAFRDSFCDPSALGVAATHYFVAIHGRAPEGVPLVAYARIRLAEVDERLGAFAPALRELELAEIDGVDRGIADYSGPRLRRIRELLDLELRSLASRASKAGTLRLLLALQPPNGSMCTTLHELERSVTDWDEVEEIYSALTGSCEWHAAPTPEPH